MKAKELAQIRKSLSLTQVQMAEKIGVESNTVARWERGELRISEPVSRLVRLIERIEKNPKLKCELEG